MHPDYLITVVAWPPVFLAMLFIVVKEHQNMILDKILLFKNDKDYAALLDGMG
jgi:hypothetical protein